MAREFEQIVWEERLAEDLAQIVRLAVAEDLGGEQDWTTVALVPISVLAKAHIVSRGHGVIAGLRAGAEVLHQMGYATKFVALVPDGTEIQPGQRVAEMAGAAREILTAERPILNMLGRLAGIASLTSQYVSRIQGTKARIYDTRKTTPGYRRLEKYAVRCGGGSNHRGGLNQAILIKDNHLAFGRQAAADGFEIEDAVHRVRQYVQTHAIHRSDMIVEVEVDSLEQLQHVLPTCPDIVLLDNMSTEQLTAAVRMRDADFPTVQLEASGGVNLQIVRAIAETGVERISVGALTHSAPNLDVGLDWCDQA